MLLQRHNGGRPSLNCIAYCCSQRSRQLLHQAYLKGANTKTWSAILHQWLSNDVWNSTCKYIGSKGITPHLVSEWPRKLEAHPTAKNWAPRYKTVASRKPSGKSPIWRQKRDCIIVCSLAFDPAMIAVLSGKATRNSHCFLRWTLEKSKIEFDGFRQVMHNVVIMWLLWVPRRWIILCWLCCLWMHIDCKCYKVAETFSKFLWIVRSRSLDNGLLTELPCSKSILSTCLECMSWKVADSPAEPWSRFLLEAALWRKQADHRKVSNDFQRYVWGHKMELLWLTRYEHA